MMTAEVLTSPWTIYAIVETAHRRLRVRYIGRTTKPLPVRLQQHGVLDVDSPVIVPLQTGLEMGLACQAEADWIATFDSHNLLNRSRPQAVLLRKKPNLRVLVRKALARAS